MVQAIFTSYEGDYHFGVGALLNSVIQAGFTGEFHVFNRGGDPPWIHQLQRSEQGAYSVLGVQLFFHSSSRSRHFGYDKPFQGLEVLDGNRNINALYYFDPDVVVLSPWTFFAEWVDCGIGAVLDCNAPIVPFNHPWRRKWRMLTLGADGISPERRAEPFYANSGFFCLSSRDRHFLSQWAEITLRFERDGGNTNSFCLECRWQAVTGDQDLLASALERWDGHVSLVGPDGMGFNGHYWLMSHATERPKPWARKCVIEALKGHSQKRTVGLYLANANTAFRTLSWLAFTLKRLDYMVARIVSSFYRRPSN